MQKKSVLILFYLLTVFYASAQFQWSNPQPSGYINTKVVFTDVVTGYVMNYNGDLIKTTNSGMSWNIYKNFSKCRSMDVQDSVIVIGGADTIVYISTDRGNAWKTGIIKQNMVVEKIQIINKDTVFALCKNSNLGTSELYQSKDGGSSWQLVNGSFIIKAIDFINSKLGYATSFGGVYKTIDGGISWQKIYNQTGGYSFITLEFFDQNVGYACQDHGVVLKTSDGGGTWNVCLSSTYDNIHAISFADASTVFLGGEDGALYRSTDNGANWQFKAAHTGYAWGVYSMYFINATTGYLVGHRGQILKTTNGGDSYQDYAPTYIDIKPISFPVAAVGYAASWNDLFKTIDSGKNWVKLPFSLTNTSNRFQYLSFFSKDTGIAIAESPVQVYKTYNGGQTWESVTLPILYKDDIKGYFALGDTVYANIQGAYGYSLLQSTNQGTTWHIQSQNVNGGYQNLHFVDAKTGYSSMGPYLYKTTDSAKTWVQVAMENNYSYSINSIWFTSAAIGYLAGNGGYNRMTVDSGKSWTPFQVESGNNNFWDVFAIRFFTKKIGYLTSKYGGIFKTFDGGKNWKAEKSSPWECKTIEMTSDTSVYLTGEYGTILKKDIREYDIDSLQVSLQSSCSAKASANISAVLWQVDSVWFEYGKDFSKSILANSYSIKDSTVKCEALLQNLVSDSNYTLRVKVYYRNNYFYSDAISFRSAGGLPPKVSITASANPICANSTVSFKATATDVDTSSIYQWQVNGNNTGTNDSVFTTSALKNGEQVKLVFKSKAACISSTSVTSNVITMSVTPTVVPAVSITASTTIVCPGTSVTFTASPVNGGNAPIYQWYKNGIVTGTNSNSYTSNTLNNNDQVQVVMTSNASCVSQLSDTSNTIVITAATKSKATGKASSPASSCVNKPFTVSFTGINTPGNSSVQLWENSNGSSFAAVGSQTYSGSVLSFTINNNNNAGTKKYFFIITPPATNTCVEVNNSDTTTITIQQFATPVIALNSTTLTITNADADAIYKWQLELSNSSWNDIVPVANGIFYTAPTTGNYRVRADKAGCTEYSNIISIKDSSNSDEPSVYLYPNPTTGTLTLDSLKLSDHWEVLDIISANSGQKMASFNIANQTKVTVDLDNLSAGIYLAVLRRRDGSFESVKFIKL